MIEFHGPDDECAPFPHRVVILPKKVAIAFRRRVIYPEKRFIICSACDHWINCSFTSCECEYKCHQFAEMTGNNPDYASVPVIEST